MSDNSTLQVFETIFTGVLALTSIALTVATALYVKATNRYVKVSESLLKVNEQLVELNKSQLELDKDKIRFDFYRFSGQEMTVDSKNAMRARLQREFEKYL